jgi:hypothetical protein
MNPIASDYDLPEQAARRGAPCGHHLLAQRSSPTE